MIMSMPAVTACATWNAYVESESCLTPPQSLTTKPLKPSVPLSTVLIR